MNKLSVKLLRRSFALARPYWSSREKVKARWMLLLLFGLLLANTQFNVLFNAQSGEFTSALAEKNAGRFWHSIRTFLELSVLAVPVYASYYFVRDRLGLGWRRWLTDQYLDRYFRNHAYYRLLTKADIDNPDQRISEDISSFTTESLSFVLLFASGLFTLVAFTRVLWGISHNLVYFLLLYAGAGTCIAFRLFGEKLASLYFSQRRKEADFRFGLVRIRENAEAIAFYRGEKQERSQVQRLFGELFSNYKRVISWTLRLNFFQYSHSLVTMVLPSIIIAPRVLSGELEVGRIVQASGAFASILGSLTVLIDYLADLSKYAAGVGRLDSMARALAITPAQKRADQPRIEILESDHLSVADVTLQTPNYERVLVKGLTFAVDAGEGLMIVGPSGQGKSSLLRMLAGIWDAGSGTIERPAVENMMFLPQHPYMVMGSLRRQLNYPNVERDVSDEELLEILKRVNLPDLAERCGGLESEIDFSKVLSVGERQRLAFARVLLAQPRYVLLDEATSALDRENENALYRDLRASATTIISVSHHVSLVQYHSQVLELKSDGGFLLHSARKFRFTEELV